MSRTPGPFQALDAAFEQMDDVFDSFDRIFDGPDGKNRVEYRSDREVARAPVSIREPCRSRYARQVGLDPGVRGRVMVTDPVSGATESYEFVGPRPPSAGAAGTVSCLAMVFRNLRDREALQAGVVLWLVPLWFLVPTFRPCFALFAWTLGASVFTVLVALSHLFARRS